MPIGELATTSVSAEAAVAEPPPFVAVTCTRIAQPTSDPPSVYDASVALAMFAQPPPELSQRRHWYW